MMLNRYRMAMASVALSLPLVLPAGHANQSSVGTALIDKRAVIARAT